MPKEKKYTEEDLERQVKERTSVLEASMVKLQGKVEGLENMRRAMLNMLEDVDESKRELLMSQKWLKAAVQDLKEMDLKKNEFISIASHELKTPITSIRGFVQLLIAQAKETSGGIPTECHSYLHIINEDTARLSKLVTDILDLSRLDLKTMHFEYETVHVASLVKDLVVDLTPQLKSANVKVKVDISRSVTKARLDSPRVEQVLTNLLTNALKYSSRGGVIVLYVKKEGNHLRFSVKDSGTGIPKKYHDKIFERFYQVDSSLTRKKGGSGLGLAVCKELVVAMRGTMGLKSVPGKGSTFFFILPISQPTAKKSRE